MKRLWLSILVFVIAAFALTLWLVRSTSIPVYQGKDVYQWMLETKSSALESNPGLMGIGTNAVPFLAKALVSGPTRYDRYRWVRTAWFQRLARSLRLGATWTKPASELQRWAGFSLLAFGFEARPALPELHQALVESNNWDRQQIVHCLSEMGCPPESLPWIVKAWHVATNDATSSQDSLLFLLGVGGTNAARVGMPLVIDSLQSRQWDIRGRAAEVLARWAQPAPEAIPRLLVLLNSTNDRARVSAASALGRITNRCDEALPNVRELLSSTNDYARAVGAVTLWRLGRDADESRRLLEGLLKSHGAKGVAAGYLGEMGTLARASVPALLEALHESAGRWVEGYDRAQCARAILRIQGDTPEATAALEEAITIEQNYWVRTTMCGQIAQLGPLARPLLPALRKAATDTNRNVRYEAAKALELLKRNGYD
jgi:HEAT repeat protein